MKKIIFVLLCIKLNAQHCKVVYSVAPTFNSLEKPTNVKPENFKFVQNLVAGSDDALKSMYYNLVVNNHIKIFELDLSTLKHENVYALAKAGANTYYAKHDTIYSLGDGSLSKDYPILQTAKDKWILENETKLINGYTCYKAKIEQTWRYGNSNDGMPTYFVTAWYCPKIPLKHGHKCYGNLPGLILELQDDKVTYQAISIQFDNVPSITGDYLKKRKIISEEKYYENVKEMTKAMKYTK